MMDKAIVGLTLSFIVGIVLGKYLSLPFLSLYLTFLLFFGLSVIFYLKGIRRLVLYLLFSLIILTGSLYFRYAYFPHSPSHIINFAPSKEALSLTGKVINRPKLKGKTLQFVMEVEKIASEKENGSQKMGGEKQSGSGKIEREVKGKVELIKRGQGNPLMKWAYRSRDWMVRLIEHSLPQPQSAVLKAIMLGDKDSLPAEVKDKFLKTGTGQVLVVSGIHVHVNNVTESTSRSFYW